MIMERTGERNSRQLVDNQGEYRAASFDYFFAIVRWDKSFLIFRTFLVSKGAKVGNT